MSCICVSVWTRDFFKFAIPFFCCPLGTMVFPPWGRSYDELAAENIAFQARYENMADVIDELLREVSELREQNELFRHELRGHLVPIILPMPHRDARTIPTEALPPPPLTDPPLVDPAASSSTSSPPSASQPE
jgi:hypothetical protein